ncbi:MAG: hypothetical protein K5662_05090 [Lachnospiraceae bacterium]|nr:hypothetical protein [Lachnospiraceae bacterium]
MEEHKRGGKIDKYISSLDNSGASMLIVLAIFMVAIVVAAALMVMVNASNVSTGELYDQQQAALYSSSIFRIVDKAVMDGKFNSYFVIASNPLVTPAVTPGVTPGPGGETEPVIGHPTVITLSGFEDTEGNSMPVELSITPTKGGADMILDVSGQKIYASYRYTVRAGSDPLITGGRISNEAKEVESP